MKPPIVRLTRNLRKSLLQGDPWVYRQALKAPTELDRPSLCKVHDNKDVFLGWGLYDPMSPLALRMLSLEKNPPDLSFYERNFQRAADLRKNLIHNGTNAFRLINGEGDYLPGVICDVYSKLAVLQFDGEGPFQFWDQDRLAEWVLKYTSCASVYFKPRHDSRQTPKAWGEDPAAEKVEISENQSRFFVDVINGQKTGFFLDQRENRDYVKSISRDKSVLNLFSYSGGFSVYAGRGGACKVTSVDIAQGALDLAQKNWSLNSLAAEKHQTVCADVFQWISNEKQQYDIVICDPPSLAKSEKVKESAMKKYIETFSAAARLVSDGGHLVLSSCSSHVSFEDFREIIAASLSKARKRAQVLRVSGQGPDHPYPHACPHLRYLKFVDLILWD